jgi:hypothetical protein
VGDAAFASAVQIVFGFVDDPGIFLSDCIEEFFRDFVGGLLAFDQLARFLCGQLDLLRKEIIKAVLQRCLRSLRLWRQPFGIDRDRAMFPQLNF